MNRKTILFQFLIPLVYLIAGVSSFLLPISMITDVHSVLGFRLFIPMIIPLAFLIFPLYHLQPITVQFNIRELRYLFILPFIYLCGIGFYYGSNFILINVKTPYFYETGITALIDVPVYLVWNFPMLLIFILPFRFTNSNGIKALSIALFLLPFLVLQPATDQQSFPAVSINIFPEIFLLIGAITLPFIFRHPVVLIIALYLVGFFPVVLFGTSNIQLVKSMLGLNTTSWEGLFVVSAKQGNSPENILYPVTAMMSIFFAVLLQLKATKNHSA